MQFAEQQQEEIERLHHQLSLANADITILRGGAVPITDTDLDHFEAGIEEGREEMQQQFAATIEALKIDLAGRDNIIDNQRRTIERLQDEARRSRENRGGWGDRP